MENQAGTTHQARRFLLLVCLTLLAVTSASLYYDLRGNEQQYQSLAADVARSFYQAIDTMRNWNLKQGGVYVREDGEALPNPHLSPSMREIVTADGVKMAMINHAHMTRLLSELLTHDRDIHIHITSATPIRPENKPDEWERSALNSFEQGSKDEIYDVTHAGRQSLFRYIAPLRAQDSCYECHEHNEVSQRVRGGISVSFSYAPFLRVQGIQRRRIFAAHAIFVCLGLALTGLTGWKMLKSVRALQESTLRIKRLEGFLPICSNCKKIRLEGADYRHPDSWIAMERYIQERTDAEFTHGICPECAILLYPELYRNKRTQPQPGEQS